MRRLTISLLAALAVAGVAAAQQPAPQQSAGSPASPAEEKLPTPEQLLSAYLKAKGGAELERKFSSRVMKGTFEIPALAITGTAEMYMAAPDKFFSVVRLGQAGDFAQGFDGQVCWSSDPNVGLRECSGEELAQVRRHSQFYRDLQFSELYTERRVTGKTKVGDKDAWVLEALSGDSPPEKFYFDVDSGLLVRHDTVQVTPDARLDVEQYYSDYSRVDGLMLPMVLRHVDPQTTWQVHFTEITHNVPIEAAKFAKPTVQ